MEQDALTPLTTPQQILHHPPFIEANASIFCMHDVPMQEQENCFIFGFDGIWTYDRVSNGFTNFVSTRYGFPFSDLQTSEISSNGEAPKFDKMTAAVPDQNSNFETAKVNLRVADNRVVVSHAVGDVTVRMERRSMQLHLTLAWNLLLFAIF